MADGNRGIYLWSVVVLGLSAILGLIFTYLWQGIYGQVKSLEQAVLAELPFITSGGIQIVAMAGLGLFLAWAILFTLDWRKRIQGKLVLFGTAVTLTVLGFQGIFLPHMVEHPIQNSAAFIIAFVIGVLSEVLPIPIVRDTFGDLFYIDPSESSLRPLRINTKGAGEAEFPIATRALFLLIVAVLIGANLPVLLGDSVLFAVVTVGTSLIYIYAVMKLIGYEINRSDLNVEIIGPAGSGKTLFFYGLDDAIRNSEDRCKNFVPSPEWSNKITEIETNDQYWPVDSTKEYSTYAFKFLYGKFHRKVKIVLHDFPGEDFDDIRSSLALRTDGGSTTQSQDGDGDTPNWMSQVTGDDDSDDTTNEGDGGSPDTEGDQDFSDSVNVDEVNSPEELADALKKSDVILALIDTRKVVEENFSGINSDDFPGKIGNADSTYEDPEINEIRNICNGANPDEVVAIATKADILIDKYKKEKNADDPHEGSGDFDEFAEYVDDFFTSIKTFQDFKSNLDISTIKPVYYRTAIGENEEEPTPVKNNDHLQPEGFNRIVDDVLDPKR